MLWLEHVNLLPVHEVMPGMRGRFIHSETMTFAFWEIDAGFELPEHQHSHEQVAHLIEGVFELTVQNEKRVLHPGAMTVIGRNYPHSGKAQSFCRILDIFYPRRDDYVFEDNKGSAHG